MLHLKYLWQNCLIFNKISKLWLRLFPERALHKVMSAFQYRLKLNQNVFTMGVFFENWKKFIQKDL